MIPKITINLQNGTLGAINSLGDGVCGLVIGCDPTGTTIVAGDKFLLRSYDDAVTAGLTDISFAAQQIKEFYDEAGLGSKLYVMIVANTVVFADLADKTKAYAKELLDYSQGKIALLGLCRLPAAGYTPTVTKGIDNDVITALTPFQALAEESLSLFTPFVGIIEGKYYQGTAATLDDLTNAGFNFVGVAMAASGDLKAIDANSASVGLLLGRAAAVPVQRKIARVKDGGLAVTSVYYADETLETTDWQSIAEKAYITIGTYANKTGYYFTDDVLATDQTEDYKTICNRRVMNKLVRLVYQSYINELNDDIELTAEGKLSPATAKYYEGLITNAVNNSMTANGELSSFSAYVNQDQNVLSTSKVAIRCAAVPKGYSQEIVVTLGFSNPALSA